MLSVVLGVLVVLVLVLVVVVVAAVARAFFFLSPVVAENRQIDGVFTFV